MKSLLERAQPLTEAPWKSKTFTGRTALVDAVDFLKQLTSKLKKDEEFHELSLVYKGGEEAVVKWYWYEQGLKNKVDKAKVKNLAKKLKPKIGKKLKAVDSRNGNDGKALGAILANDPDFVAFLGGNKHRLNPVVWGLSQDAFLFYMANDSTFFNDVFNTLRKKLRMS